MRSGDGKEEVFAVASCPRSLWADGPPPSAGQRPLLPGVRAATTYSGLAGWTAIRGARLTPGFGWGPDRVKEHPLRRISPDRSLKRRSDALHDSKDVPFDVAGCRYIDGRLRPRSVAAALSAMHEAGDNRRSRAEMEYRRGGRETGLAVEEPDRDPVAQPIPIVDQHDDPSLPQGPERWPQRCFGRY